MQAVLEHYSFDKLVFAHFQGEIDDFLIPLGHAYCQCDSKGCLANRRRPPTNVNFPFGKLSSIKF